MATLYHFRLCPFSRSIRLALGEVRQEASLVEERPWEWRREFLAVNPSGALPVLTLEGAGAVCGAYAISEYLAEGAAAGTPALFPGDRVGRAEVRRLVDWFHLKMNGEATQDLIEAKVRSRLAAGQVASPDAETLRGVRSNLRHHLAYVEYLAHNRNWLAGESLSFADLAAAGHISCIDYLGELDWTGLAAARSWYARLKSRPAMQVILAERLPGTPPPPPHYADPDF